MTGAKVDTVSIGRRVLTIEARALQSMADALGGPFAAAVELLYRAQGRVVCTGMGKSGHVARKIAATFASTGTPAVFVHPAEASHGDLGMIGNDDVILGLSKSGEAKELADIIAYSTRFNIPLIGMTAMPDSALGRASQLVLLLEDATEATAEVNAPTTSTTLQMALGDALAVALLERRGFTASDFRRFHPGGRLGAQLATVADLMHSDFIPLVAPETRMLDAILVMTRGQFGCVGVQDTQGRLIGLITDGDLRRHAQELFDNTASGVMTPQPLTITAESLAAEALKRMNERQITVLFVARDQRPVGILHIHDLLRAGI